MKKFLSIALVAISVLGMSSCSSIYHTSTNVPVETAMASYSLADLQIGPKKISYTLTPNAAIRRTGEKRVIETAVAQALKENGNADVLVGMQYEIKKTKNLFGKTTIKYVTVSGYPATYVNFRPETKVVKDK